MRTRVEPVRNSSKAFLIYWSFMALTSVSISQNKTNMDQPNNPLLCKPDSGLCEIPTSNQNANSYPDTKLEKKPVKIIYFTDPICSACWGIEAQLRKLKLEYGHLFEIEYRMGGLLPDWSYNAGGISKPSDVAVHWEEVSKYYDMPIVGDVWLEDPLSSSYPPSIAFKAAQLQNEEKAILFLRELREMVFMQKKNITKWEHIEAAAKMVGLDCKQLETDYQTKAKEHFTEDLKLSREAGVRGFPTLLFLNNEGKQQVVFGAKPYNSFQVILLNAYPKATAKKYDTNWTFLFSKFDSLTAKEFSLLSGTERNEAEKHLNLLTNEGSLQKLNSKNGALWKIPRK